MEKFLGTVFYYLRQQLSMYAVPVVDSTGFRSYQSEFDPFASDEKKVFYALNDKAGSFFYCCSRTVFTLRAYLSTIS